jgi:hypothetical protein
VRPINELSGPKRMKVTHQDARTNFQFVENKPNRAQIGCVAHVAVYNGV